MTRPPQSPPSRTVARAFGFTRLIVELGVVSSFAFSLALFLAAIVQAYHTIWRVFGRLGQDEAIKELLVAAIVQADVLLVGVALLIISLGLQALFIGEVRNVPAWLRVGSFDDLKQKLIGIVITALAVNFLSVALDWRGGTEILSYGAAVAAVMTAVGAYSLVLARQGSGRDASRTVREHDGAQP